jgi:hypothetical protein
MVRGLILGSAVAAAATTAIAAIGAVIAVASTATLAIDMGAALTPIAIAEKGTSADPATSDPV